MLRKRIIPSLSLQNASLVKTINFKEINYIEDEKKIVLKEWYDSGGQSLTIIYSDSSGSIKKWYPNGNPLEEINYANGLKNNLKYRNIVFNPTQVSNSLFNWSNLSRKGIQK